MAYLEGLTHGSQEGLPETRAGFPLYAGSAHRLKEWQFKIKNRMRTVTTIKDEDLKSQKMASLITSLIDALSDDALKIAMDMTEEELAAETAVQTLMDRIEANSARFKKDEARELHRAGSRTVGPMCRQTGESIISYISRRRRWYKRLRLLDESTVISENILSDSLMDCSGTSEQEKLSIRTLAGESTEFEVIATHMQRICRDLHTKESRRSDGGMSSPHTRRDGGTSSPHARPSSGFRPRTTFRALGQRGWKAKPTADRPKFRPHGHFTAIAEDDEQYEESEEGEAEAFVCAWTTVAADDELEDEDWLEEDHPDLRCYTVQTVIDPEEFQNVEEQIAHDVLQSFVTAGADVDVPEHCNQICHCFHTEREAFFAREGARRSGAKITPSIHNFRPRSELSFDDRKKMLAKAKSNSKCKRCGEKGHWQGDPECKKGKGAGKGGKFGDGGRSFAPHQGHGLVARTAPTARKKLSAEARVAVAVLDNPKAGDGPKSSGHATKIEYEMIDDDAFIRDVPPPSSEAPRASSWPASCRTPLAIRDILLRYEVPDTPGLSRIRKPKRPASRKIETADGATPRAIEESVPSISFRAAEH